MTSLAPRNEHLALHRRLILLRSLAAGIAGLAPVPYLDDWMSAVIRRNTIRRIADARRVDLDEDAVRAIAEGVVRPPGWRTVLGATPFARFTRRAWRNVLITLSVYRRAEEASRAFATMTLFDHYCARLHVGAALDKTDAQLLRMRIETAINDSPKGMGGALFRRGLFAAARATVRAPFELLDAISGGRLRRRLSPKDEIAAEEIVEDRLRKETEDESFLTKAARAIDRELGHAGRSYLDPLIARFEELDARRT